MFIFNLTQDQLQHIRSNAAHILADHDDRLAIGFHTKTLSFFEYMEGWEYEDLCPSDIILHSSNINVMLEEIISHVGEEIPETEEESDAKWDAFEP